jgi:hypothetical protein
VAARRRNRDVIEIVPLHKPVGFFVVVDPADAAWIAALKLHYSRPAPRQRRTSGHAKRGLVPLDRLVLTAAGQDILGLVVIHRNGWGLDCRRENLRALTKSMNMRVSRAKVRRGIETSEDGYIVRHRREKLGQFPTYAEAMQVKLAAEDADGFPPLEDTDVLILPLIESLEAAVSDGRLRHHIRGAPMIEDRYRIR